MAIVEAADYFQRRTGRQVTYEYVLLGGLNDGPAEARQLAGLLRGRHAHVNLIPFNDVEGLPYRRPLTESLNDFVARLRRRGLVAHVRKRKGADIDVHRALGAPPVARQNVTQDHFYITKVHAGGWSDRHYDEDVDRIGACGAVCQGCNPSGPVCRPDGQYACRRASTGA